MLNIVRKGLVGLALLATLGSAAVMADTPSAANTCANPGHHQRHGFMQRLNLSADQQTQIKGFVSQYLQQQKTDRQAFVEQLKLVLNQDQMARLQAHRQAMRERWEAGKSPATAHRRGHRAGLAYLHLTDEQKAQVQVYRQAERPQQRAEHEQLTSEIRGVLSPDQQVTFDQMRAHRHFGARFQGQS